MAKSETLAGSGRNAAGHPQNVSNGKCSYWNQNKPPVGRGSESDAVAGQATAEGLLGLISHADCTLFSS